MDTRAEEILKMAGKIQENQTEEEQLTINLHKKIETSVPNEQPLIIGKTPNSLIICGADEKIPLSIDKRIINKAMRAEKMGENGRNYGSSSHGLTEEQLRNALMNIKNPMFVLKGSRDNSLVAVTEQVDNSNREIIVAIHLNKEKSNGMTVNDITSIYGKDKFQQYLDRQINAGNLLAVNIEKADNILPARELHLSLPEDIICFNDSIAYTMENVKYPEKEKIMLTDTSKTGGKESMGDITLVSVEIYDSIQYFQTDLKDAAEVAERFKNVATPFSDMSSTILSEADFAELEQSDQVKMSVAFNLNDNTVQVYEINHIPEADRTDDNTEIKNYDLENFLNVGEKEENISMESQPVGRIDYLGSNGKVKESMEYTSEHQFLKNIEEDNSDGIPMVIVLYQDKDGKTISRNFADELDPPVPLKIEDLPIGHFMEWKKDELPEISDFYPETAQAAEFLIDEMENSDGEYASLFSSEARDLLVNYAYHTGDFEKTKQYAEAVALAGSVSNPLRTEMMDAIAQAEGVSRSEYENREELHEKNSEDMLQEYVSNQTGTEVEKKSLLGRLNQAKEKVTGEKTRQEPVKTTEEVR